MLYGSQEPTFRYAPPRDTTHGDKCTELMRRAGFPLMPWQSLIACDWLARRDGKWAASAAGLSVCRQVGKTRLCCARIAFGMVAYGEWCVYTSHLQKTSTETFEELRSLFESPVLKSKVDTIKTALGREEIILKSGARCKFLARTRNGGRGQHGDLWIVDEALELDDEQQASFMPMLAASKNPQTIYLSSPPYPGQGETFRRLRATAQDGESSKVTWSEWGVQEIGDVEDRERWSRVIPSLGYLIDEQTVESEMEQLSPEKFAVERLGLWSAKLNAAVIPRADWDACATEEPPRDGIKCFAAKFSPDGRTVALCVCLKSRDESFKPHIELVFHRSMDDGVAWLVSFLADRAKDTAEILIDGVGTAENVRERLLRAGAGRNKVRIPRYTEVASANAALLDAVRSRSITYYKDDSLDAAAHGCTRRKIGTNGGWGFASSEDGDAAVIEAAALALLAATNTKRDPNRKARIG